MNIILGASGQVGGHILQEIRNNHLSVRAVVRRPEKLPDQNVETRTADLFNLEQLTKALEGGTSVFLLTPENPASNDIIGETKQLVENYRKAIQAAGIKKVVALSSIGAHVEGNTGNLIMSRILEEAVDDLDAQKVIVRPSYYYSNWLAFLEPVRQYGVLPTFFPEDLKVDMNSPAGVAEFIAGIMINDSFSKDKKIFELVGPQKYSSLDVAETFAKLTDKQVEVQPVPKEKWKETLLSAGFTDNTAANLSDMTQAVIDNLTLPENQSNVVQLPITLQEYLREQYHRSLNS